MISIAQHRYFLRILLLKGFPLLFAYLEQPTAGTNDNWKPSEPAGGAGTASGLLFLWKDFIFLELGNFRGRNEGQDYIYSPFYGVGTFFTESRAANSKVF